MIKLVYCLRRLESLSREEFQRYWLGTHGPLVRENAKALAIRRYVQVHTLENEMNDALRRARGAIEPFDGVAELWFDRVEDMATSAGTPEGAQAARTLLEDERRFIDLERSALWIAQEHPIIQS